MNIGIRFIDDSGDAVPLVNGNMNPATAGACGTACDSLSLVETSLRFGRLRLLNTYGSELLKSRVEYRAEYWDGNRWTPNTADTGATATALPCPLPFDQATCAIFVVGGGLTVSGVTGLTNGVGFITFNIAATGFHDIAINLNASGPDTSCNPGLPAVHGGLPASMPWLQGFWSASCNGTPAWRQDPNARIRLGSPRAPYIYLRERY